MSTTRAVWIFLFGLTAIRLALIGATELSPDEAYYWMWSERPALSYFSKGPGIAFVIRSSTMLFGDNEFGVRFWSPLLAAGTSLLLYYFAQRLFSALAGLIYGAWIDGTSLGLIALYLFTFLAVLAGVLWWVSRRQGRRELSSGLSGD